MPGPLHAGRMKLQASDGCGQHPPEQEAGCSREEEGAASTEAVSRDSHFCSAPAAAQWNRVSITTPV